MPSEEKNKNKSRASLKLIISIFLFIFVCFTTSFFVIPIIVQTPFSTVWWINGIVHPNEMEAAFLERIPLGSTESEVENFIRDNLPTSDSCTIIEDSCVFIELRSFTCLRMLWIIGFRFENQLLTEIVAHKEILRCV